MKNSHGSAVQSVEQSVNSRFQLARFRLFNEQINGGLADCCDVVVDGVAVMPT